MNWTVLGFASLTVSHLIHEAGHWLAALSLGLPIERIRPWAVHLGEREEDARDELVFLLGGPVANLLLCALACLAVFVAVLVRVVHPALPAALPTGLGLLAVISALYGVGNLIPLGSRMDGRKIWMILSAVRTGNS
jgi:Zn-dependent protease